MENYHGFRGTEKTYQMTLPMPSEGACDHGLWTKSLMVKNFLAKDVFKRGSENNFIETVRLEVAFQRTVGFRWL